MAGSLSAGVADAPVGRPGRFRLVVSVVAIGLGLLAFVVDLVGGSAGQVLIALTSSGFAWGLAAFLVGRAAETRRRAAVGGAVSLVIATLVYYLLVLLVSRRWSGGLLYDEATGVSRSADAYGLRSLAVTAALWLGGSVVAGPLLALLGHTVRSNPGPRAALAAGAACGLLSGEGWFALWRRPLWRLDLDDPYGGEFARGVALAMVIRIVLPVSVLVWLAIAHRLGRSWASLLGATLAGAGAGALVWAGIESARNLI